MLRLVSVATHEWDSGFLACAVAAIAEVGDTIRWPSPLRHNRPPVSHEDNPTKWEVLTLLRRYWWLIGVGIVLLAVLVHPGFFFNPVTFHQDAVTYLPWSWYKSPLRLEYVDQSATKVRQETVDDQDELRYVLAELKKGLKATRNDRVGTEKPFVVAIRLAPDGYDVLFVYGTVGSNVAALGNDKGRVPVLLTDDLRHLIERRLEEAARVSGQ